MYSKQKLVHFSIRSARGILVRGNIFTRQNTAIKPDLTDVIIKEAPVVENAASPAVVYRPNTLTFQSCRLIFTKKINTFIIIVIYVYTIGEYSEFRVHPVRT